MSRFRRSSTAVGLAAALVLAAGACSDEDGDGATTDEEIGEISETIEDGGDQLEEELEQGESELEGEG